MKRVLATVVPLLALLPVLYAAAAGLNVNGGVLQAGGDTVGGCDNDSTVTVGYTVTWSNGFQVTEVKVGGIHQGCNNATLLVQLTKNGQGLLPSPLTTTVKVTGKDANCPGGVCTLPLTSPQSVTDITDVHVAFVKP